MTTPWQVHARSLADEVTHPGSRWYPIVAGTPRHTFVPAWWTRSDGRWRLLRGPLADVYTNRSLVTRVGTLHADDATEDDTPTGLPTSSSTHPGLVLTMYRYGQLGEGLDVLDVGTGSGYGAGLLARRYGGERVMTVDIDPYLVEAAAQRLEALDLHPTAVVADATGPLPVGAFDRIVSMVSVPSIPPSWLDALRPGGRLATTISGTWMILTATKTPAGIIGQVERDWAGFMRIRSGPDYPPTDVDGGQLDEREGEHVGTGRYPVLDVADAWELSTLFTLKAPGVRHSYHREPNRHTAFMAHPDGSWARATATGTEPPTVHQGGPRRLWDILDDVRDDWLRRGWTPVLGARAVIRDDGSIRLLYGDWRATIPAAT